MSAATDSDAPIVGSKGHMGDTLIDVNDLVMHFLAHIVGTRIIGGISVSTTKCAS